LAIAKSLKWITENFGVTNGNANLDMPKKVYPTKKYKNKKT